MKFLCTLAVLFVSVYVYASDETLHCELYKVDKETHQADQLKKFCDRPKKNQRILTTTTMNFGQQYQGKHVWQLVIQTAYPTIRYRVMSFDEEFLNTRIHHKLGTKYDITFKGHQLACYVDKNPCTSSEEPMSKDETSLSREELEKFLNEGRMTVRGGK